MILRNVVLSDRDKQVFLQLKMPVGCELLFSYLNAALNKSFDMTIALGEEVTEPQLHKAFEWLRENRVASFGEANAFEKFTSGLAMGLRMPAVKTTENVRLYTEEFLTTAYAHFLEATNG